jgi:hypothetical protein
LVECTGPLSDLKHGDMAVHDDRSILHRRVLLVLYV